jgi:hypothetical protein
MNPIAQQAARSRPTVHGRRRVARSLAAAQVERQRHRAPRTVVSGHDAEQVREHALKYRAERDQLLAALKVLTDNAECVEHDSYILHGHEHFQPEEALATARALIANTTK